MIIFYNTIKEIVEFLFWNNEKMCMLITDPVAITDKIVVRKEIDLI